MSLVSDARRKILCAMRNGQGVACILRGSLHFLSSRLIPLPVKDCEKNLFLDIDDNPYWCRDESLLSLFALLEEQGLAWKLTKNSSFSSPVEYSMLLVYWSPDIVLRKGGVYADLYSEWHQVLQNKTFDEEKLTKAFWTGIKTMVLFLVYPFKDFHWVQTDSPSNFKCPRTLDHRTKKEIHFEKGTPFMLPDHSDLINKASNNEYQWHLEFEPSGGKYSKWAYFAVSRKEN